MARRVASRLGEARHGLAGRVGQGWAWHGAERWGTVWQARLGTARLGWAGHGLAGVVRLGMAWRGVSGRG